MSTSPLLFNPSRASLEELEATFVARQPLLESLEGDLISDAKKRTKRHWQLIGPRGSGKSHITELIARHLTRDHGWAVARLPEEHYQVSNVGELLEQILVRLEQAPVSPLAGVKSPLDLEELAVDQIRKWKEHHRKPILVILENLGILFERKLRDRRSQSRLREILTRDPPFVLLATATSYVDATVQHDAPFYDFFQAITLEDLSSEEVATLVEARARWDMDELLLTRLDTVRARAHAVFHFSGGNPRLVLALYSILRRGFTDELHTQILKLLDEVTPYYQQRLNDISPQMGRILAEMALSGGSLTPSEIAKRCRMQINHVTANIAKLDAERFVRATGRPDKRRRNYDLNDRLFRLWMQMREDHTARQRLRFLSEFFQHWYEGHPEEVRHAASRVAEAFWQDLPGNAQRCREHIVTLDYLQDALPDHSELLLTRTLTARRPPASRESAEEQVRSLRPLFRSDDPVLKAIAGLYLASALEYLRRPEEGLQILRDADSPDLPLPIRSTLFNNRISFIARVTGAAKAISDGLEIMRQVPEMWVLRSALAGLSMDAGDLAAAENYIREFIEMSSCKDCISKAVRDLIEKIVDTSRFGVLERFLDLFATHAGASEKEIRALRALAPSSPEAADADRVLQAVASWSQLAEVPWWLIWSASCTVSHAPGRALEAFPLLQHVVARCRKVDYHTGYHLLLVLLDAVSKDSPSFDGVLDWIMENVTKDELKTAFMAWMPEVARTRTGESTSILRVYTALRERDALPMDLLPYSAAVEVTNAPEKMSALSPEIREAVTLLMSANEQKARKDPPARKNRRAR